MHTTVESVDSTTMEKALVFSQLPTRGGTAEQSLILYQEHTCFFAKLFSVLHTPTENWVRKKINSNHPLHIYLQNNKKTFFSKQDVSRVRRATKNIIMIEGCNIFCSSELIIKKPCKLVVNTYISSTSFGKKLA